MEKLLMKKNVIKITMAAISIAASLFISVSCASNKSDVPLDMTAREIVQKAQTAYDSGDTVLAEKYYNVLLARYGNDTSVYIEGRFELAHIYVKQQKYKEAAPMLQDIIDIYNNSIPGQLPGAYKKLAEMDLQKIPAAVIDKLDKKKTESEQASQVPAESNGAAESTEAAESTTTTETASSEADSAN